MGGNLLPIGRHSHDKISQPSLLCILQNVDCKRPKNEAVHMHITRTLGNVCFFLFYTVGPPQFGHYAGQQANEIKVMHKFAQRNSNFVLLGDFNHGPALPGITWELPLNYGLMTAQGLLSVTVTFCGQCTYCSDNILAAGNQYPLLLDHIYIPANQITSIKKVDVSNCHTHILIPRWPKEKTGRYKWVTVLYSHKLWGLT